MSGYDEERDVRYEIIEEIGVIATLNTGWTKELNLISWNGGVPKYDIREWDPFHLRMSRGITLHENEMRQIIELIRRRRSYASRARRNPMVQRQQETAQQAKAQDPPVQVTQDPPVQVAQEPARMEAAQTQAEEMTPVEEMPQAEGDAAEGGGAFESGMYSALSVEQQMDVAEDRAF